MKLFGQPVAWASIGEVVDAQARRDGDRVALEVAGRELSCAALDEHARALAGNLHRHGVRAGDRVAAFAGTCWELIALWVACSRLGAIWVPLNVALEGDDLSYTLADVEPALLVVDGPARRKLDALPTGAVAGTPRFELDGDGDGPYEPFADLLAPGPSAPPVAARPGDPCSIVYTGGTTGLPKGVIVTQFAFVAAGLRYRHAWEPRPDDVHFTTSPLFHVSSHHGALAGALLNGVKGVIDARFSLRAYWRRVRETGATLIDPIGAVVALLAAQPSDGRDRDHRVRAMWDCMLGVPEHLKQRFRERFGIPTIGTYALTETGGSLIVHRPAGPEHPQDANGRGWGWCEYQIVDEQDQPLPAGEAGEIVLRPLVPHVFTPGYWRQPEQTVAMTRNLWLHTGDVGRVDEAGYLYLLGRQAHWLRRRGENISAYEVESAISRFPGVAEVCVVAVPSELGEDEVKAFIVPADGALVDPAALVAWLEGRIARFKIPRYVELIDALPRTASKHEIEREKVRALPNDGAWDREDGSGVGSSARRPPGRS